MESGAAISAKGADSRALELKGWDTGSETEHAGRCSPGKVTIERGS